MHRASSLVTAILCLGAVASVPARATTYTYDFTGICSDCSGTATAQLVLTDYTLGQDIDDTNFYSFTYNGTNLPNPYTITASMQNVSSFGSISGPLPDTEFLGLFTDTLEFISNKDGTWCTGARFSCSSDVGNTHLWSLAATAVTVPEPLTASLLGGGLLGLAALRRRARLPD